MNNNDILIRLRYALDIKNIDMVKIFKLGGIEVTKEEILMILTKAKDAYYDEVRSHQDLEENVEHIKLSNEMLDSFLNGFIIFKRGERDSKLGEEKSQGLSPIKSTSVNNIMMKKLKIALSLTSEEMLEILELAGVTITKGELSAVFRKEGHKNYKECGDRYARNFLKGLALKHRS